MLTETWAAAYFQSLIMVLLFVLGVPALIIQFVAPSDSLYRLVQGRFRLSPAAWFVLASSAGITIFFAWALHPHDTEKGWAQPALWWANGVMTLAIVLAAVAWVVYLQRFTRVGIIRRIYVAARGGSRQLRSRFRTPLADSSTGPGLFHINGRLSRRRDRAEQNLALLGETSRPGQEKREILETLSLLLAERIEEPGYDGTRFEGLLRAVRRTILASGSSGNEENFRQAAHFLGEARNKLLVAKNGSFRLSSDHGWLSALMADLSSGAAANDFQATEELLEYLPSEKLLEVGVAAWKARRVSTYANAASKLSSRLEAARSAANSPTKSSDEPLENPAPHLLALLAHLCTGGSAARHWSDQRLEELRGKLGAAHFRETVDHAWKDRFSVGDFESADALEALRQRPSVDPAPPPRKQRPRKKL